MVRYLPLAILLVACGDDDEGNDGFTQKQTGGEEASCDIVEERTLAIDETASVDHPYAAEDVLDALAGLQINVLEWPDKLTINLDTEFTYDMGEIAFREMEINGALAQDEIADCYTALDIEGTWTFITGDGSFNETLDIVLRAAKRQEAGFKIQVAQADLMGSWTPETSGIDAAAYSGLTLEWNGWIDGVGSGGEVTAWADDGSEDGVKLEAAVWAPQVTQGR